MKFPSLVKGLAAAAAPFSAVSVVAFQGTFFSVSHDSIGFGWMFTMVGWHRWPELYVLFWLGVLAMGAGLLWKTLSGAIAQTCGAALLLGVGLGLGVLLYCWYFYGPCVLAVLCGAATIRLRLAEPRQDGSAATTAGP